MSKFYLYIFTSLTFIFLTFLPVLVFGYQSASSVEVEMNVTGCNNNGMCEANLGENHADCPLDCPTITTPPSTPPTSSGSGSGGSGYITTGYANNASSQVITLTSLNIVPGLTTTNINWITDPTTKTLFSWGLTSDYELGSESSILYGTIHTVTMTGLEPGKLYYASIVSQDLYGHQRISNFEWNTLPIVNPDIPVNVSGVVLTPNPHTDSVTISWNQTSTNTDVRVIRSPYGYPKTTTDGKVVYEGTGTSFVDSNLSQSQPSYYGIFSSDGNGHYSSGVFVATPSSVSSETVPLSSFNPYANITIRDLSFYQNSVPLPVVGMTVSVDAAQNLFVALPVGKLSIEPDQVFFEILSPKNTSRYGLIYDPDRQSYESTISLKNLPPGSNLMALSLVPQNTTTEFSATGTLFISSSSGPLSTSQNSRYSLTLYVIFIVILIAALVLIMRFFLIVF